jgi:hypothetical protein
LRDELKEAHLATRHPDSVLLYLKSTYMQVIYCVSSCDYMLECLLAGVGVDQGLFGKLGTYEGERRLGNPRLAT